MNDMTAETGRRPRTPDEALQLLLAPGDRWGWEHHDLSPLMTPYPVPPPAYQPIDTPDEAPLMARAARAAQHRSRILGMPLIPAILIALFVPPVVVAILEAAGHVRKSSHEAGTFTSVGAVIWVLAAAVIIVTLARNFTAPRLLEGRLQRMRQRHADNVAAAYAAYSQTYAEWQRAAGAHEEQERRRLSQLPSWGAVRFRSRVSRVDVFGDQAGWPALLTTVGGSVLGSGQGLVVLDFSQAEAPARLVGLAAWAKIGRRVVTLPGDVAQYDPLAGLSAADVKDVLVEAFCSDGDGSSRERRLLASRALDEVLAVLGTDVSMARVWRALRVLLGFDTAPGDGSELSTGEWKQLSAAFSDEYRAAVGQQLFAIEAQLHALRGFGAEPAAQVKPSPQFECYSLSRDGGSLLNELLYELLFQQAVRSVRKGATREVTIMVVGADDLKERHLASLASLAAGQPVRLVFLFRNLTEGWSEFAGSGGAVGFLRLSNAAQAERAADWIGREYSFQLSQETESRGTNESRTTGGSHNYTETVGGSRSISTSSELFGHTSQSDTESLSRSDAAGENWSQTDGSSEQRGTTRQRVYEHVVEPEVLRSLPLNALLLVEFNGARRVVPSDVTPDLALSPAVSPDPIPAGVQARLGRS
jgi:hypothetical protein